MLVLNQMRFKNQFDLNKPTVVAIEDDNSGTVLSIEDQLEEMVRKQIKKSPPSVEELQQMIDDIKYHLLKNYSRC